MDFRIKFEQTTDEDNNKYKGKYIKKRDFLKGLFLVTIVDFIVLFINFIILVSELESTHPSINSWIFLILVFILVLKLLTNPIVFFVASFFNDRLVLTELIYIDYFIIIIISGFMTINTMCLYLKGINNIKIFISLSFVYIFIAVKYVRSKYRSFENIVNSPVDDSLFLKLEAFLTSNYMGTFVFIYTVYRLIKRVFFNNIKLSVFFSSNID